jgi:hypothetical protein
MKNEKGFIVPLLVVIGFAVIAAVAYFHARPPQIVSSPTLTTSNQTSSSNNNVVNVGSSVLTTANSQALGQGGEQFVQVTDEGTAAQRFNLQTFTDTDESFAISFPRGWSQSGSGSSIFITNGESSVSVASQTIISGTSAAQFATASGATNGFMTKAANAYDGYEVISGNTTTYYLVNGAVGYKIGVTDSGDTDTLRQILLTFTYTRAR